MFIRSTDQQLRDIRDETDSGFACVHVDTCLPDYLNDHHNRDGELLLGVPIDGSTTVGEVKQGLISEFADIAYQMAGEKPGYDHLKARQSITDLFADVHPMTLDRTPFDDSLDILDGEEREDSESWCYAYFVITWNVPEDDD